jgi:YspA SLOG family
MIVAWTGHRPDLFRDAEAARTVVDRAARELAEQRVDAFLVGGQRGVDTWAAQSAIEYGVPFRVALPFDIAQFTREWLEADRSVLSSLLRQADAVRIVGGYSDRNRALATQAQLLLAVWTGTAGGGTSETIDFARQVGTPIREFLLQPAPRADSATGRGV